MPRLLLALAALALMALLSGCATLSKAECQTGDWRALGVSDGTRGFPTARFERHVEACSQHGIVPSQALYLAGHTEGLQTYCRLDNAAEAGTRGAPYYQVCTGEIGLSFGRVYVQGRDVYDARDEAGEIRSEISEVQSKLADPNASDEVRAVLDDQLDSLERSLDRQEDDIAREERELRNVLADEVRRLNALGIAG